MVTAAPAVVRLAPRYSSDMEIVRQRVDAAMPRFSTLFRRWNFDESLFHLEYWDGEPGFEQLLYQKMRSYTTNSPRVYGKKVQGYVNGASLNVKIPNARELDEKRTMNQGKKDWIVAALKLADKRLKAHKQPPLQRQLSHHLSIRGWAVGRVLLRTDFAGRTVVDITPWDIRNVTWELGPQGLMWACNRTWKTMAEIAADHPGFRDFSQTEVDDPKRFLVYDYYDAETNMVFAEGLAIKARTRHGAPEIPVYMGYTGGESPTSTGEWQARLDMVGESIYSDVREIYSTLNFLISIAKQVVAMRRQWPYTIQSTSGEKTLAVNPYLEGAELSLKIGEKIELLQLPELGKDFDSLLAFILGELQRGSLPFSAFGELAFQLSGYAINTLREGIGSVVDPIILAAEDVYQEIADKLCNQYATGLYPSISIPGEWDDLAAHHIRGADEVEIKLTAHLPEDMAAQMQVAAMARTPDAGGVPILDDTTIHERVLHIEDVQSMKDRVNEQTAERLTASARAYTLMEAATNRGNEALAQDYFIEYQIGRQTQFLNLAMMQMQLQQMGLGMAGGMPMGGGMGAEPPQAPGMGEGEPPGVNNAIAPQQMLGAGQPAPTPQSGPNVPPGSARPGDRQGANAQNMR